MKSTADQYFELQNLIQFCWLKLLRMVLLQFSRFSKDHTSKQSRLIYSCQWLGQFFAAPIFI